LYLLLHVLVPAANAQFKEIGPPPFSPAVARQQIRTLLDQVEPANRQQTLDKLNGLTPWFRNILDEELIACWERDGRERLTLVMEPLASPRVAAAVVEFSWSARRDALNLAYAPMLGNLMARYPESGKGFLSDLLGPAPPNLSPPEAETVCRILLDMPDIGTWRQSALRILPRYRATAERLLIEDRQGDDPEKSYRAQVWLAELRGESPGATNQPSIARRKVPISPAPDDNAGPSIYASPPAGTAERRPQATAGTPPPVQPPPAAPVPASSQPYNGPMSGTLECNGGLVPQNAEYVFGNLPPLKIQLDYNKKIWEGRLAPGENQTQRLILKNKSSGPQKRCVVHWSVVP
jgi:hypothetical protein